MALLVVILREQPELRRVARRLDKAELSGPFYPDVDSVTYTITFDDYGTEKNITRP